MTLVDPDDIAEEIAAEQEEERLLHSLVRYYDPRDPDYPVEYEYD